MPTVNANIAMRLGTTSQWAAATVPLLQGEWGMEITEGDEHIFKVGDGESLWADLPVFTGDPSAAIAAHDQDEEAHPYLRGLITALQNVVSGLDAAAVGAIPTAEKDAPGGVAGLTAGGKVATSVLPALAITDTFPVDDESEMLALTAQRGDVAIRSDLPATFILAGDDPSVLGDWVQLPFPPDSVLSVNGETGVVVLTAASVGAATAAQGAKADTAVQSVGGGPWKLWLGTESEYEAIDPKDPGTFYAWTEDP